MSHSGSPVYNISPGQQKHTLSSMFMQALRLYATDEPLNQGLAICLLVVIVYIKWVITRQQFMSWINRTFKF